MLQQIDKLESDLGGNLKSYTQALACTCTHIHTHAHAHTYTYIHTHAHTCTHVHRALKDMFRRNPVNPAFYHKRERGKMRVTGIRHQRLTDHAVRMTEEEMDKAAS